MVGKKRTRKKGEQIKVSLKEEEGRALPKVLPKVQQCIADNSFQRVEDNG